MPLPADIALKTIDGKAAALGDFAGQALVIVNVASRCGFTPQYAGLEALHRRFRARGFAVLGFPCDQFGHQEPGDEAEIKNFCSAIRCDLSDVRQDRGQRPKRPSAVRGAEKGNARPPRHAGESSGTSPSSWSTGKAGVVRRYAPSDKPETLAEDIQTALG